jgi:hypothetical protein
MRINDILKSVVPLILLAACATGGSAAPAWRRDEHPDEPSPPPESLQLPEATSAAPAWHPDEHPDEPSPPPESLQLPEATSAAPAWHPDEHPDKPSPPPER